MYNPNERYQLHWATIFVSSLRLLREMILPIVVLIALNAFKDGLDGRGFLIMAGIGFASFAVLFIASVLANFIRWSRFTYWFEEDELRIESGVFVRNKRYIPFERIQSLNYTEPLAHRIFGLVKVEIETASGSGEAEAALPAVSKGAAEAIEYFIQETKKRRIIGPLPLRFNEQGEPLHPFVLEVEVESEALPQDDLREVYTMTRKDLVILAVTSSGVGVILSGLLIFMTQFIDLIPFEFLYTQVFTFIRSGLTMVLLVIFGALFVTWLLSIALTFISYHQFRVTRDRNNLFMTRGLIEKKKVTVPLSRVQSVEILENPFRQLFGYCTIVLHSAGGAGESSRIAIFPLVKKNAAYEPLTEIFPELHFSTPLKKVPERGKHFFHRIQYFWAIPFIAGISYSFFPYGLFALLLLPVIFLHGRWKFKTARYAYEKQQLTTVYRQITKRTVYVLRPRIQSLTLRQSYFHQRRQVGTILCYIKSGMTYTVAKIPFMDEKEARQVMKWYEHK